MIVNKPDVMTHEQAIELLPWLVNDSLPEDERKSLLEHSRDCLICRRDLAELETLKTSIDASADVAQIPPPDIRRINQRIDQYEENRMRIPDLLQAMRGWLLQPLHAAVVIQSIVILGLVAAVIMPRDETAVYTTLTSASALPGGEYARIVVSTRMNEADWTALLEQHALTAAEGPSEQGVATLAFAESLSEEARASILAELAQHPDVRFVQPLTVARP